MVPSFGDEFSSFRRNVGDVYTGSWSATEPGTEVTVDEVEFVKPSWPDPASDQGLPALDS